MSGVSKGWMRIMFERSMRLTEEQAAMENGHYTVPDTQGKWSAFKAGMQATPNRGTFVIAEIRNGQPHFPTSELTHDYKDSAKDAQRKRAERTGIICAVFQLISAFDPSPNKPKN